MTDDELRALTDQELDQIKFARRSISWDPKRHQWEIMPGSMRLKSLETIAIEREICRRECGARAAQLRQWGAAALLVIVTTLFSVVVWLS